MKTTSAIVLLLALGTVAAWWYLSDKTPEPVTVETPEPAGPQPTPPPPAPTLAAKIVAPPPEAAELRAGERSAEEIASPWTLPETERSCAAPYRPDLSLELPLVVDSEPIPLDEIKRHLCLGLGVAYADYHKFQILNQDELDRRKEAGEDISTYLVSDEELDAYIQKQREDFALRYPTLDFELEVGRAYMSYDLYRGPAAQLLVFNKLFLPENPSEWPELTKELIRGWGGDMFIDDALQSYERRKQMMIDQGLDEIPPDDPIIVQTWRDIVLQGLNDFADIETHPSRLPEGVLMTVDGRPITIEQVWSMIGPYVTTSDLDYIRRFLALCKLLENDLAAKGVLMSQDEFEVVWMTADGMPQQEGQTYRQKLNQHGMIASQMVGTSSLEAYALYNRLMESMRREFGEQLEDMALLREWSAATAEITGAAKRDLEVILCSAWDGDMAAWKENGWADARKKAFELIAELRGGADWTSVRELHSEFWDPPMPEDGPKPMFTFRFKGAFGEQTHNQMMTFLEESEGHSFVYGTALTQTVFYEQSPGTILGPRMGSRGYHIIRLNRRTPPMKPLDLSVPLHRLLIQNYYLRTQMRQRAHELLVAGLEAGTASGL